MIALCTLLLLGESAAARSARPHPLAPRRSALPGPSSSSAAAAAATDGNCVSAATGGEIPLAVARAVRRRQRGGREEADIALVNSGGLGTD